MSVSVGPPEPGDLGWLIGLHGRWYSEHHGLGLDFEATVARIAGNVAARLRPPGVTMWVARDETGPLATLTADLEDPDEAGRGHIRIVIAEPRAQGQGLGGLLLSRGLRALKEAGAPGAYLDTYAGLDAARRVYEKAGFRHVREAEGTTWGRPLVEQRFALDF